MWESKNFSCLDYDSSLLIVHCRSTLLRRMAKGLVPGFPVYMKVIYLQQELPAIPNVTALEFIKQSVNATGNLTGEAKESFIAELKEEESQLEKRLDTESGLSSEQIEEMAERLCEITELLDGLSSSDCEESTGNSLSGFVRDIVSFFLS